MIFQSTRFVNDFYRKFFRFPMATASISHVLLRQWQCRLHVPYIANCVPILCTRIFYFANTKSALNSTLCEVIHSPPPPPRDRTKPTNRGFLSPPRSTIKPSSSIQPGVSCPLFASISTFEPPSRPSHRVSILFNRFNRGFLSPIHRFLAVLMGRSLPPARRA